MEATLVCLLLVIKIKNLSYQQCKRQSEDTNVIIGGYKLSAKRPIPIIGASLLITHICSHNLCQTHCVGSEATAMMKQS